MLIWAFDAQVTRLIQLYIVGVFVSFTLSQLGHGAALDAAPAHRARPGARARAMKRSRVINAIGLGMTGDRAGRRADHQVHARRVDRDPRDGRRLRAHAGDPPALRRGARRAGARRPTPRRPARCRAGCTRSCWSRTLHKPTMRAARLRPGVPAVGARGGDGRRRPGATSRRLREQWEALDIPVPLRVLDSPFREITRPILDVRPVDPAGEPARPRRRLHPRVRRRALVGAAAAQPERAAAQEPAAVHARASSWRPCRGSWRRPRAQTGLEDAGPGYRSAWLLTTARGPRARRSSSSRSGRSPTAGTAWRGTRAASSSSGTRCPASGCAPG